MRAEGAYPYQRFPIGVDSSDTRDPVVVRCGSVPVA
jgi:hypothetical protein